MIKRIIIYHQK